MSGKTLGVPLAGFAEFTKQVIHEGCVLLKNESNMLPIRDGESVALFGRCQIDFYRSGTGSGGAVNVAYTTNLLDSLRKLGRVKLCEELAQVYESWIKENPFDNGGGVWAGEPWHQKEMPVTVELAEKARNLADKAVFIIGRTAGEDQDNADVEGSYRLTAEEKDALKAVTQAFENVAVILNVSNIIDMSWLNDETYQNRIKSVLYAPHGGAEGGGAVAEVITQAAYPSGKLTDTVAVSIKDYPSDANFGDPVRNYYQEDIYVGYRYFQTFCPQKVMYPFGFGLSYTDFATTVKSARLITKDGFYHVELDVAVENTGVCYSGKQTVQVYLEAPQGKLGRPLRELAVFAKTPGLSPKERHELHLSFCLNDIAAYDDSGCTGNKNCYVLEAGEYRVYAGDNVRDAGLVKIDGKDAFNIESTVVVKQLSEALAPIESFTRMKPGKMNQDGSYELTYENVPVRTVEIADRIQQNLPEPVAQTGNRGILLKDVCGGKATLDEFIAQLSDKELATLVRGEGMGSDKASAPGTAAVFGGISESLFEKGIPIACAADGPSGIRMGSGYMATQMPIGTLLASTWNISLVEELYVLEGKELLMNDVDTLLGPGINIHRHPMNGRNFEYYSEDPLLTGAFAAAASRGINKSGCYATIKHFACNNQEAHRTQSDSAVSQRAIREIYLKAFEIAVNQGGVRSVMTSYNPVNGHWAASNYDLNTTVLRGEWGFDGIVMTDWWAKMNDTATAGEGDAKNLAAMIRSQNDIYMVVNNDGAEVNSYGDNILDALDNGSLTKGELQRCCKNLCNFLIKTPALFRKQSPYAEIQAFKPLNSGAREHFEDICENSRVIPSENVTVCIKAKKGRYDIIAKVYSPLSNMAQSSCDVTINGEAFVTVITNGTGGKRVIKKIKTADLGDGYYELDFNIIKQGIEIEWIEFSQCGR